MNDRIPKIPTYSMILSPGMVAAHFRALLNIHPNKVLKFVAAMPDDPNLTLTLTLTLT